jgi:hypothetical protein
MTEKRYIPKLETIAAAAEKLPKADDWRSDTFHVTLQDERLLEFRKVKFKGTLGRTVQKWIYEGKIRVD